MAVLRCPAAGGSCPHPGVDDPDGATVTIVVALRESGPTRLARGADAGLPGGHDRRLLASAHPVEEVGAVLGHAGRTQEGQGVFGRKELDKLNLQKQALLVESSLNRVALQAEIRSLRSATSWVREATSVSRELGPLLVLLAPLAGFLVARGARRVAFLARPGRHGGQVDRTALRLWKSFSSGRNERRPGSPPPDPDARPGLHRGRGES